MLTTDLPATAGTGSALPRPDAAERLAGTAVASRPSPLTALTGLRFVAALHVVLFHYGGEALAGTHWTVRAIVACGPSAVSLFFLLSGAVLAYSCADEAGNLRTSRGEFWRARFARIYPLYAFALLLDAPFFASALLKAHDGVAIVGWGLALGVPVVLLLHGWTALTVFAWNIPGWSLSAEAFFYAVFPSFVRRLRCTTLGGMLRFSGLLYAAAIALPLIVIATQLSNALPADPPSALGGLSAETWLVRFVGFSPIARLPEFLMGICLGHWLRNRRGASWSVGTALAAEAGAIALLAGAWLVLGSAPEASKVWLDSALLAPLFGLLIAVLAIGGGPVAKALSVGPMLVLGDASYALYILQEPVVIWAGKIPLMGTLPAPIFVTLFVLLLVGASVGSQRLVAEPARRWLLAQRARRHAQTRQPVQQRHAY